VEFAQSNNGPGYLHLFILVIALIWLASAVWAVVDVMKRPGLSLYYRIVWSLVAILIPVAGVFAWLVFRSLPPRPPTTAAR